MSTNYNIVKEVRDKEVYRNKSVDTDVDSQKQTQREEVLDKWDEDSARKQAKKEGLELTDDHFQVLYELRNYYRDNGPVQSGRELDDMLDAVFASKGGRKYLHKLFPQGPVSQGMQFAGLPVPAHSEDGGFGTAR